ncbi:MAG: S-layer homology domain-containing protein [Gemmatimonadaceae bacterium]|nr:S-layer homology domain-containing protein [Gloeobacterales cyanobacterium ES-bin-141]
MGRSRIWHGVEGLCVLILSSTQVLAQLPPTAPPAVEAPAGDTGQEIPAQPSPAQQSPAPQTPAEDVLDVRWTQPYAKAVEQKTDIIVLNQSLDAVMTRVELVRWLTAVFGYRPIAKKNVPLKDLPKNSPDYLNVQAVLQAGIMSTFTGGQFKPEGDITKLEAIAIFDRALKLNAPPKTTVDSWLALYQDASAIPPVGKDFIAAAAQAGLLVNYPDSAKLGPDDVLTRGETTVLLHQSLVYQKKLAAIEPPIAQLKLERPTITAIDVQPANGTARVGQAVTVTVQGTAGSKASFDFGDLANNVAMQETSPGQYQGSYQVGNQDVLINPTVVVRLDKGGINTQAQKVARVQVGEPRTATQTPEPTRPAPDLYGDNPSAASSRRAPSAQSGSYSSDPPIASTPRRRSDDLFGSSAPFDPPPRTSSIRIQQVGYDPTDRPLYTGDILTVSLAGDTGGKATFRILGYTGPILMKEISPGFYEGQVQIGRNLNIPGGTIEVALERSGQRAARNIPEPVNIVSR